MLSKLQEAISGILQQSGLNEPRRWRGSERGEIWTPQRTSRRCFGRPPEEGGLAGQRSRSTEWRPLGILVYFVVNSAFLPLLLRPSPLKEALKVRCFAANCDPSLSELAGSTFLELLRVEMTGPGRIFVSALSAVDGNDEEKKTKGRQGDLK